MWFTVLVLCLFILHCQAEGDVREETLSVKTGTDLLLDVEEPVTLKEDEFMLWKFKNKVNIVRLTDTNKIVPHQIYKGRAGFFPQNQSLLLKNVQKTDSGGYWAGVSGSEDRDLAQYQVTVVDPVSDVKLEVKQCSSDRSDLTVTCTTLDALLSSTFICENTTCSHEGGEPVLNIPPGASMKVYLKNGSVTCHHSNQVSSTEDTKTIEDLCRTDPGYSSFKDEASKIYGPIIPVILVAVCGAAVAAVYYLCYRQQGEAEGGEKTDPIEIQTAHRDKRPGPGPRSDAQSDSPETGYSMIGAQTSAPTEAPTEPPNSKMQPENQYATMGETAKS